MYRFDKSFGEPQSEPLPEHNPPRRGYSWENAIAADALFAIVTGWFLVNWAWYQFAANNYTLKPIAALFAGLVLICLIGTILGAVWFFRPRFTDHGPS